MSYFLSIFTAIISLLSLETILIWPKSIWFISGPLGLLVFLAIKKLTGAKIKSRKFWSHFLIPFLFLGSGILFLVFLESLIIKHLVILVVASGIGLFLFLWRSGEAEPDLASRDEVRVLEAEALLTSYFLILTSYFFFSSLFALLLFLTFPVWISLFIVTSIIGVLSWAYFELYEIRLEKSLLFILVLSLVLAEMFWVVSFLPTGFYVASLILTLVYWVILGLSGEHLRGKLERGVIERYLVISIISLAIVLITARWV